MSVYPCVLEPILYAKVWGGDRLAAFGKPVSPGAKIGESWELADMAATSAAGAGGGAARSVIRNGSLTGLTLHEAVRQWGAGLLGATPTAAGGAFPLLVKFLDAKENLSLQVHPSPEYATLTAGAFLKTECWYIMDAEPGAVVYKGVKAGVGFEEFSRHVRAGTVAEVMIAHRAVAGECHNLPSGTVHALGAGVLVAEVQTPSDTTYRLYDWGRTGREMHFEQGLASARANWEEPAGGLIRAASTVRRRGEGEARARLVTTEFFIVDELALTPGGSETVRGDGRCVVLTVLEGSAVLAVAGGPETALALGTTVVIPAAISSGAALHSARGARLLGAVV